MAVSGISSTSNYYTQAAAGGPVSIATAMAAIKANSRTKVSISDTTQNIANNLESLRKIANNINGIAQTDASTVIDVTASQWSKLGGLLSKFSTSYQLRVSGVTAANAASVASNSRVNSFSVTDNSKNITAQMGTGLNNQSKLTSINNSTPSSLITLTATQLANLSNVVGKFTGNYGLAVTNASVTQAVGYTNNLNIRSVSVQDTVGAVSSQLEGLRGLGLRLKEVRGSDSNTFTVTANQVQTDALVIGKLYKGYQLSVLGASMQQAQSLASNNKLVAIDIVDSAANLSANLDLLKRLGTDLRSIDVTDVSQPLKMSSADYGSYTSVLDKILADDNYTVAISDASVSEAQALLNDAHVSSVEVADASAAISANLNALQNNAKVTAISQKGKTSALEVSHAQLTTYADALAKITDSYSLNVTDVSAGNALNLAASNSRIASVAVSDTGANITSKLDDLAALGKRLTRISQSDSTTALSLSVSQWSSQMGTLSKISGGYSLQLSGVSAARAERLLDDSRVRSVSVSDSAAAISSELDKLHGLGSQLTGITQTDSGNIAITATQWSTQASTLAKLGNNYTVAVRNAQASQLAALQADSKVKAIAITDSSANIARQLDALQDALVANGAPSITVRQAGTASPMAITAAQLTRNATALGVIGGNYSLAVSGVTAANASSVAANGKVASMTVSDTGANLVDKLSELALLGTKVRTIAQSDAGTNRLAMTASQWAAFSNVVGKISTSVRASISDVKAAGANALLSDARVAAVSVNDNAAQISAHLDRLQGLGTLLSAITQSGSGDIALTMDQLRNAASTLGKISNSDYTLAVRGATVSDAQTLLGGSYSRVRTVAVSDTSANIAASLDDLQANTKLVSLTQTGTAAPLALNKAQLVDDADALAKIQGSYSVAIQDAGTGDVSSLNANSRVSSMVVTGSASDIVSKLADLQAAGSKVSSLRLSAGSSTLAMTQAQWMTHQPVLAKISQNYSVTLSGVSASQATSLAGDPRVASVAVSDSTSRINASLDAMQALGSKLSAIAVTDSGTPPAMTISAAQYFANAGALGKIAGGNYSLNVTGASMVDVAGLISNSKVSSFTVSDSSDNIAASLTSLNGQSKLTAITQSGTASPMTLSASLFNASSATLGLIQNSYSLNIEDASVADAAGLQANSRVVGFTLSATTSEVNGALSSLAGMGKLGQIHLSADDGVISVTSSQLDTWSDTLGALQGNYRLNVTGVTMDDLATVRQTPGVASVALTGSSADISDRFDELVGMGGQLGSLTVSSASTPIALTYAQWQQGQSTLAKVPNAAYLLALVDVRASDAATAAAGSKVESVSLTDSASNIVSQFDALTALGADLDAIELSDEDPVLQLTQAQYDSGTLTGGLLTKLVGTWDYDIVS